MIVFVASASILSEIDASNDYIDSFGMQCLSVFRALGLPSTAVLIRVSYRSTVTCFLGMKSQYCNDFEVFDFPFMQ